MTKSTSGAFMVLALDSVERDHRETEEPFQGRIGP